MDWSFSQNRHLALFADDLTTTAAAGGGTVVTILIIGAIVKGLRDLMKDRHEQRMAELKAQREVDGQEHTEKKQQHDEVVEELRRVLHYQATQLERASAAINDMNAKYNHMIERERAALDREQACLRRFDRLVVQVTFLEEALEREKIAFKKISLDDTATHRPLPSTEGA